MAQAIEEVFRQSSHPVLAQLLVPVALPCIQAVLQGALQGTASMNVTHYQTGSGPVAEPVLRYASGPRAVVLIHRFPTASSVVLLWLFT